MFEYRALKAGLALVGLLATPSLLPAQVTTPSIMNIQSGFGTATNGAAITAGTPSPGSCSIPSLCLNLFINGNFNSAAFESVTWTENNVTTFLTTVGGENPTQVVVNVPMSLYQSAGTATITVTEEFACEGSSCLTATSSFTVNPAMAPISPLPTGIVSIPYSQAFFTGGTGNLLPGAPPSPPPNNFTVAFSSGSPPAGLAASSDNPPLLAGKPTQSGSFTVSGTVTDSWGNQLRFSDGIVILARLVITTPSLPAGSAQHPYNITVNASGGVPSYTWAATGLPTGLTINSSTGMISGTTTSSGTFPVTVTVSDSSQANHQTAQANYNLTINPLLTITTPSLPPGTITHAYSTTVAASGGATPYAWSATGLPAGLSINPSSGVISGTPAASGTFPVTVTVTDSGGVGNTQSAQANYNLTIDSLVTIITVSLPAGTITHAYSTTVAASGGATPYAWSATGLPAGLSINPSSGLISGTPTASGTFPVTVTVTDSGGTNNTQSAQASYNLTINSLPTISTTTLPSGRVQLAYSSTVAATGGLTPYTWSAAGLPAGLSINASTGVISGTPTAAGTFSVALTDSDSNGQSAQATVPLQIIGLLTISPSLPLGGVNLQYAGSVSANGGVPPYTFSANGLPVGLSINTASGVISGTPNSSGTSSVTIRVTDSGGTLAQSAQATFPITINPPSPPPLQITTTSLGGGTAGQVYSALIAAGGGTGGYSFSVISGSLPGTVQLALGGQLYGIPTTPGTYNFTAQVTDSSGSTATRGFSIVIAPATLAVTGTPPTTVPVNSTLSVQFNATGGVAPYKIAISGSTPTGTSFSNGVLSGVASAPGTFSFTVTATDSQAPPSTASQGYTITVTPGPLVISANLPTGQVGQAYSGQFSATGGTGGYSWSGSGSNGLSVSSSGGVSGTPTSVGSASISVTVTDSSGTKASGSFSVVINGSGLIVTTTSLSDAALTVAYHAALGASGGTTPYSWSATGLPNGLSVSQDGTISGTPTQQGVFGVKVTVTDHDGTTSAATLSLTVGPAPVTITTTGITPPALGATFSVTFGATGGTPPYTWTSTGLPGSVTMDPNGTLSGTPTSTGTFPITVTVTDSKGQKTTQNLNLVVTLPPAPGTSLNGFPANGTPATQVTSAVTFSAPYPVDVTVTLKLTFAPASGPDDPNVQFATGGRTTTVTVKAGSTTSLTTIGVQTGTVAGVITITEQLVANGTDITPSPAPTRTIAIAASAPTVTSVTVTRGTNQFTVVVVGFDPTRAITQMNFTFTPAAGSTLQTSTVTIPAQTLFSQWYQSTASVPFGSQFSFTITFTVGGNVNSIQSVTVTETNPTGTSSGVSAPV
jgi:hypothetical protein